MATPLTAKASDAHAKGKPDKSKLKSNGIGVTHPSLLSSLSRYDPPNLPMVSMILMSIVLIIFASLLYLPAPPHNANAPVFQVYRQEDGNFFGADRLIRAPILYGWLHTIQGGLWCITIPLQHVKTLRQRAPRVHRWLGRLTIASSFSLSITGMMFGPRKLSYTAATLHLHKLRLGAGPNPITVLAWPSFDLALWFIGPSLLWSSYKTITLARAKRFAEHRRWAILVTLMGYIVPAQRVAMLFIPILAATISRLTAEQQAFLRVPTDVAGKSHAEKAAFAFTTWIAGVAMVLYVLRNGRILAK